MDTIFCRCQTISSSGHDGNLYQLNVLNSWQFVAINSLLLAFGFCCSIPIPRQMCSRKWRIFTLLPTSKELPCHKLTFSLFLKRDKMFIFPLLSLQILVCWGKTAFRCSHFANGRDGLSIICQKNISTVSKC